MSVIGGSKFRALDELEAYLSAQKHPLGLSVQHTSIISYLFTLPLYKICLFVIRS